ncbi:MAG: polyprenyl synthetase family protein [Bacteroidales bacterium]|jgi:geranylgeranyl diphosphate synthase type II|nr:polyprenyl synthetase family protein [Bacteroidales bacterium]MBQ2173482.1 polyprenyl synthetase family protein [Bacteroidales bacterium]
MITDSVLDKVVTDLFQNIEFQAEPAGLYDPLRYMVAIGGKRIRPRLCLTTYGIYAQEFTPSILQPAAGLEVFHTFTLIHDDIMDRSPLRRGHDTVWKRWSEDTAILSGDVMCIDAYKRVAQAPPAVLPKALALFSKTAAEVCDGQQLDMDFEKRGIVPMADYMQMIGLKTGVLIACSAQLGALIAGADERSQKCLYDYGYDLGLAFQVADDYLDAYGDQKVFGKPIGGDILNEKKSWLTVKANELGAKGLEEALAAPATTAGEKQDKIDRVMEIYASVGIADAAREAIGQLSDSAIAKAAGASMDAAGFEALKRFADSLVGRAK